jgi:hypothetical protein
MLQVARLAPRLLGPASDLVAEFLRSQMTPDGGFQDRAGAPDLYYTVFGMEGLLALRADLPIASLASYLRRFGSGEGLDFVHLSCLARGWAGLPPEVRSEAPRQEIAARIEGYRSSDGGYEAEPGSEHGTLYGCFLALGAYQDLGLELPDPQSMLRCIHRLRAEDSGYANGDDMPVGLTPSTAAAVTLLRQLDWQPDPAVADWLLSRCHPEGGFYATPMAPIPDLLSTATALHALAGMQADFGAFKEPCLDFVDSLWVNKGAFYGSWMDDELDCEYTYYGLLALGHLSL